MRYLFKDVLDHLPRPLARLVSGYIDFDQSAFVTYLNRRPQIELNWAGQWNWTIVASGPWPEIATTSYNYASNATTTRCRTFTRNLIYTDAPSIYVALICLLDIVLRDHDALVIDCGCRS